MWGEMELKHVRSLAVRARTRLRPRRAGSGLNELDGDEAALQDFYPEVEQDGQGQALGSFDPAPSASFATTASGFDSSFDTQQDSFAPTKHRPSCCYFWLWPLLGHVVK